VTKLDYIAHLRSDGEALAAAVDTGPLNAPVSACPGWDVADLARHTGEIHRWATETVLTGARPERNSFRRHPPEGMELSAWIREGVGLLATALSDIDPEAPTWHVFPVPMVAGVWPRRQSQETLVHRWDAQNAIGVAAEIDPVLASDGIDEYFHVILPRLEQGECVDYPSGTLHVHCTDVAGEWLISAEDGRLVVERAHAKGDVALRGPAADLLLLLWGRSGGPVDPIGDPQLAAQWIALGGL